MQSSSKSRNTLYQGLASLYIVQSGTVDPVTNSNVILGAFCDETDTDSVTDLNVSVETPTVVRNKTANTSSDSSQNNDIKLVAIKAN